MIKTEAIIYTDSDLRKNITSLPDYYDIRTNDFNEIRSAPFVMYQGKLGNVVLKSRFTNTGPVIVRDKDGLMNLSTKELQEKLEELRAYEYLIRKQINISRELDLVTPNHEHILNSIETNSTVVFVQISGYDNSHYAVMGKFHRNLEGVILFSGIESCITSSYYTDFDQHEDVIEFYSFEPIIDGPLPANSKLDFLESNPLLKEAITKSIYNTLAKSITNLDLLF